MTVSGGKLPAASAETTEAFLAKVGSALAASCTACALFHLGPFVQGLSFHYNTQPVRRWMLRIGYRVETFSR